MDAKEKYDKTFENGGLIIPEDKWLATMNLRETEEAIKFIKDTFQERLVQELNLKRVSAPIALLAGTGINDNLTGAEKPVDFQIKSMHKKAEIVHSLAKWKRLALRDYGFISGEGLYTDMNAIRTSEFLDNVHSIYVDQWDWERIIANNERNVGVLKYIVRKIYNVIKEVEKVVCHRYPQIGGPFLPDNIKFVHTEDLLDKYPEKTPQEREEAITKLEKAVFVIGVGGELKDGTRHEIRAADYDDWTTEGVNGKKGLNGDILIWNPVLGSALELSSMGIRVDSDTLLKQLEIRDENYKKDLPFHQEILQDRLPQSIGGGIGQSRLCMYYLRKAHIGEVQASIWPDEIRKKCSEHGIKLL
ncbi:MAG: aspartate--ammonia ligase [Candidatus Marinimicrobia bacterium]|nr:aspartate--ammonia ligase [Candidatus Neomarinimicrobiota bacterium]